MAVNKYFAKLKKIGDDNKVQITGINIAFFEKRGFKILLYCSQEFILTAIKTPMNNYIYIFTLTAACFLKLKRATNSFGCL